MQRPCLLLLLLPFWATLALGQPIFRGQAIEGAPSAELTQSFTHFGVYHIDAPAIHSYLQSAADGGASFHLRLGSDYDWPVSLVPNEVRTDNYSFVLQTENGRQYQPRSATRTFKGQALLPQGGGVRLTVNEHFIYGFLEAGGETYYIEPAWLFDKRYPEDYYVAYPASAIIRKPEWNCATDEAHEFPQAIRPAPDMERSVMACYQADVALAADFQLFSVFGSATGAEDFMLGVLNNVQSNYDNEFSNQIVFAVVTYFVSTCSSCDPWPSTTNSGDLLDAFTSWGNSGGFGAISKDVASLWTNRNLSGDVIGVAWVGGLCSNLEYNVLQRFSTNADLLRVLQAHEIGHNFNASHDASGSPFIMAPAVQNTSQWSTASTSTINNFISAKAGQGNCFGACGSVQPPVAVIQAPVEHACAGGFVPFTDASENDPVSWSWSFPGGIPSTSSLQNPVVFYPTPGTYTVTLEVTNAGGSDFTVLNTDIQVDNNGTKYLYYETFENGLNNWQVVNPDNSKGWELKEVGGTQFGSQAAYMDNYFYNSPGAVDALVSPAMDFSGQTGIVLQVDYAYRRFNPQRSDQLKVLVSTDGGATFPNQVFAGQENGGGNFATAPDLTTPFTPSLATDWCYAGSFGADCLTINLSAFAGQPNVKIRIENVNQHGNGMYIDNVRVSADCIPLAPPAPDFIADVTSGCFPLEVNFQDYTIGQVDSWSWQFPGGLPSSSSDPFPTVTYNVPGTYNVTLSVSNGAGTETITRNAYITVQGLPEPDFIYNVDGLTGYFDDISTDATEVLWQFGDGSSSTELSTSHTYASAGEYTVTLTATNDCGQASVSETIMAEQPIQAAFSADTQTGCPGMAVAYSDETIGNPVSWHWFFEGGTPASSALPNPTVTYNQPGAYQVTLAVDNGAGSVDTIVQNGFIVVGDVPGAAFNTTYTAGATSAAFTNTTTNGNSYAWDFGDSGSSTAANPTHAFPGDGVYSVMLIATNACGSDTAFHPLTVVTLPSAGFTATTTTGCAPLTVQFTNTSSANAVSYFWAFEGGVPDTSTLASPVATFPEPGSYTITLITGNAAGYDTTTQMVAVTGPPQAGFTVASTLGETDIQTANTSVGASSYLWDFGDDNVAVGPAPAHTYTADGLYTIIMVATNACGSDTASQEITIITAPTASFEISGNSGCAPFTVQPSDLSSSNATAWLWSAPGASPESSTDQNPVFVFNAPGSYTIELEVSNAAGSSSYALPVTVGGPPQAGFTVASTLGETDIQTANTSVGASSYLWDFGDDNVAVGPAPAHTYTADGLYTIIMVATNACGSDTASQEITIITAPTASFEISGNSGCAPFTVQPSDLSSSNATAWLWSAPGASPESSTDQNPVFVFNAPGSYTIELEVSNAAGSSSYALPVTVGGPPQAGFTVASTLGETDIQTANTSVGASSYLWDFGDDNVAVGPAPAHTYTADGLYTIVMVATNACGSDTASQEITIITAPTASFEISGNSGCAPFTVQPSDLSSSNATAWLWSAPGASPESSTDQNPVFVFNAPGSYTIELEVSNAAGSSSYALPVTVGGPPQAEFNFAVNGISVQFSNSTQNSNTAFWSFGDGETSALLSPEHAYSAPGDYLVSLTAGNECGETTVTDTVTISLSAPVAAFTSTNTEGCAPLTVTFTNQSANGESYQWQFPGGTPSTSTEENPVVIYETPGIYSVSLVATNPAGSGALTKMDLVKIDGPPEGGFTYELTEVTASFTNTSSNADTYLWLFGDGESSTEESPVHSFPGAGDFAVQLITANGCGQDTAGQVVSVVGEAPTPAITASDSMGCAPFTVQFQGSYSGGGPDSWSWSFPGGEPAVSAEQNPIVVYNEAGAYSASLTVSNAFGENSTAWAGTVAVNTAPTASFTFSQQDASISIDSVTTGDGWSYFWDFGDGNNSMETAPVHTYAANGIYTVTLTVTNECGEAKETAQVEVMITGLEDEAWLESLLVFPNPNHGAFTVAVEGQPANSLQLGLYNVVGQRLLSVEEDFHTGQGRYLLDASALPAGVYVVEVIAGGRRAYRRVVVE
ncbi:MAG: PKD domain-containing protein [Lewinellaceae bacterium]|nr:PKD domain-containing protein [Lewinellaceae bacterium]